MSTEPVTPPEVPPDAAEEKKRPPPLSDEAKKYIESLWMDTGYVDYMANQRDKGWKT